MPGDVNPETQAATLRQFLTTMWPAGLCGQWLLFWGAPSKRSEWTQVIDETLIEGLLDAAKEQNIYIGAGLRGCDLGPTRAGERSDVTAIPGLWVDLDIADPVHKKPNLPPTEDAAWELLADMGLAPSMVVHTGHGLQAWWLFREPWILESDAERDQAEQLTKGWCDTLRAKARAHGWDADQVGDLRRVMRLPGTWNRKGPSPIETRLLPCHDIARYNPTECDSYLPSNSRNGSVSLARGSWQFTLNPAAEPPAEKFRLLCEADPVFLRSWDHNRPDLQDRSASGYDLALATRAIRVGWSAQEIVDLLVAHRRRHGEDLKLHHVWRGGSKSYYGETLNRAAASEQSYRAEPPAISVDATQENSPLEPLDTESSPPWPELDPAVMLGVVGELVRTIEPHTEADPAGLLVQILAAFGNTLNRGPHFRVEADTHYMNINAVVVGTTSKGRKGTSWGHVRRVFQAVDSDWTDTRILNGLSSGEGLIWEVRDPIVIEEEVKEKGKPTGKFQTKVTDRGVEDKRLFVLEPEFARTIAAMLRDGNTLSAVIRQAWESGYLRTMTKNSPANATGAHISIVAHITQAELCRIIATAETANGFCNRFLWVAVKRSKLLPEGGHLEEEALAPLIQRLHDAIRFARSTGELRRDDEARALWCDVYPTLSAGKPGLLGEVTSRAEAQTMRLACLYALQDRSNIVRVDHLNAALALWSYCEASAGYIFGDRLGDPLADELLSELRRRPSGMTRTEMRDHWSRNRKGHLIEKALVLLRDLGFARREDRPTAGRPTECWCACRKKNDITTKTTKAGGA